METKCCQLIKHLYVHLEIHVEFYINISYKMIGTKRYGIRGVEGKWPIQFVCLAGRQNTAPLRNYARPRWSIEPFCALRRRVAVAFPPKDARRARSDAESWVKPLFLVCAMRVRSVIQSGLPHGRFLGFVVAENTLNAFMEDTLILPGHMSVL